MSVMPEAVRNFFEKVGGFLSIVGIYLGLLLSTVLNWFKSDEKVKPDDEAKAATVTPKSPVEAPAASQVKTNDFKTSDDVVKETGGVPVEEEKPTTKKVTKSKAKPKPAVKKVEKAKVAEEKEMATPKKIVTKKKESSKKMARRGIKLKKDLD
jgi:outer membrane biosynthesis protein TonB